MIAASIAHVLGRAGRLAAADLAAERQRRAADRARYQAAQHEAKGEQARHAAYVREVLGRVDTGPPVSKRERRRERRQRRR